MLSQLHLMRLRFGLEVTSEARLPPYKGDVLRRALLWHLGTIWCCGPARCRNGCQTPDACLFGRLLEPPVDPTWSEPIRRLMGSTPPPAYVLWDEQDRRRQLVPGDAFCFELTLIGQAAIRQLPAFIAAVMVAAERGMGRPRLRGRLRRVDALAGPDGEAYPLLVEGVWQGDPRKEAAITHADGQAWIETNGRATQLQFQFLSPIKVKMRGETSRRPEFAPLARAVVRRLRILSEVHGAGEWPQPAFGPLLDLAEGVRLEHHETMWMRTARRSEQGGRMPLEGFVGQAWYASVADLRPLLPVLWLGQWVGVGKGAVWGNGRIKLQMAEAIKG
jgi:hypothetical protein